MNVFDKSLLFEMSFALMRRFAFIEVPSPPRDVFAELWRRELDGLPSEQAEMIEPVLTGLYGLTAIKDIGPAVFIDMAAVRQRNTSGRARRRHRKDLAFQLFYSYLLPQYEGITKPEGQNLFRKLLQIVGEGYRTSCAARLLRCSASPCRVTAPDEDDDDDGP